MFNFSLESFKWFLDCNLLPHGSGFSSNSVIVYDISNEPGKIAISYSIERDGKKINDWLYIAYDVNFGFEAANRKVKYITSIKSAHFYNAGKGTETAFMGAFQPRRGEITMDTEDYYHLTSLVDNFLKLISPKDYEKLVIESNEARKKYADDQWENCEPNDEFESEPEECACLQNPCRCSDPGY